MCACAVQSRGCFHLCYIKYTYLMYRRSYTKDFVSGLVYEHVCLSVHVCVWPRCPCPKLLVLMCYCAGWWLIMTLNVYEHWSVIAPKWEPFHILTGYCLTAYWWMHNDLQYDATGRPAHPAYKHMHTQAHSHTHTILCHKHSRCMVIQPSTNIRGFIFTIRFYF